MENMPQNKEQPEFDPAEVKLFEAIQKGLKLKHTPAAREKYLQKQIHERWLSYADTIQDPDNFGHRARAWLEQHPLPEDSDNSQN